MPDFRLLEIFKFIIVNLESFAWLPLAMANGPGNRSALLNLAG
ncbi:hypothetical protein [Desulfobacter latus]|nr:hypothetical protein [Desulfobacter latus]